MARDITDRSPFEAFFIAHYNELHAYGCYLYRNSNRAWDALNDLYAKMKENGVAAGFPEEEKARLRYLNSAIHNKWLDELREEKTRVHYLAELPEVKADEEPPPDELLRKTYIVVKRHRRQFTDEQWLLLECMFNCVPEEEQERIFGKSNKALSKLRYKIALKIRLLVDGEDLI